MKLIVLDPRASPPQQTFTLEHSPARHSPRSLTLSWTQHNLTGRWGLAGAALLSGHTWGHCAENPRPHLPPSSLGHSCARKLSKELWEDLSRSKQSLCLSFAASYASDLKSKPETIPQVTFPDWQIIYHPISNPVSPSGGKADQIPLFFSLPDGSLRMCTPSTWESQNALRDSLALHLPVVGISPHDSSLMVTRAKLLPSHEEPTFTIKGSQDY